MLQLNFTPFPTLTTERLILRAITISDDNALFYLRSNDEVNKYIGNKKPESVQEVHPFINKLMDNTANNEAIFWVISLKDAPTLIGTFCFWNINKETDYGEIGYTLHPAYWGKGYMHEAMQAAMRYGTETMQLKTIEAYTHQDNIVSRKLLEKNNFKFIPGKKAEEDENLVVYAITS